MSKVLDCCFSDCSYNLTPGCTGKQCPENVNNVVSKDCRNVLDSYCTGEGITGGELIDAWTKPGIHGLPNCVYYLTRKLLRDTPPGVIDISTVVPPPELFRDASTIASTRNFITSLVRNYQGNGYRLGSQPNERTFSPLEGELYSICSHVPGICSDSLNTLCADTTGDMLVRNPSLAKWCGCYMPDREYERYVNQYQVTKPCTPYCLREESVPLASPSGNFPSLCTQNTCILDDITITLQNSTARGGINFSQVCGNCGQGEGVRCTCVTSNTNIEIINSQIEGIDFTQECNAGTSKCYQQIGSFSLQVPCEQGEEVRRLTEENINRAYRMRNFQIIILVLGSIILIGVIWYIITLL